MRMRAPALAATLTTAGLAASLAVPPAAAADRAPGKSAPGRGGLRHGRQPLQRPERQRPGAPRPQGPARGAPARRHLARMRPQLLRHPAAPDRRFLAQPRRPRRRRRWRRLPPVQVVSAPTLPFPREPKAVAFAREEGAAKTRDSIAAATLVELHGRVEIAARALEAGLPVAQMAVDPQAALLAVAPLQRVEDVARAPRSGAGCPAGC